MDNVLVDTGLKFMLLHLKNLTDYTPYLNDDESSPIRGLDKIITETALLLVLLNRDGYFSQNTAIKDQLISLLQPIARSERNAALILRFPQLAGSLGISHIALNKLDSKDPDFDFIVKRALQHPSLYCGERLPFRDMDLSWVSYIYFGGDSRLDETMDFYNSSILGKTLQPIYMQRADYYALTHCVMYLTDFGQKPLNSDIDATPILVCIREALLWNLHEKDFDLIAELLLTYLYLGGKHDNIFTLSLYFLKENWNTLGFLPSRSFDVAEYKSKIGIEKQSYGFSNIYHTLYVGMILLSYLDTQDLVITNEDNLVVTVHLNPDPFEDNLNAELTDIYSNAVCTLPSNKDWIDFLEKKEISTSEKNGILIDIILFASIRNYDLDVIISILQLVSDYSRDVSGIVAQAVDFLQMQEISNSTFGAQFLLEENASLRTCTSFSQKAKQILIMLGEKPAVDSMALT